MSRLPGASSPDSRRMVRAELMGGHSHSTLCGVWVHVWRRGDKYLARGRYERRPFGETLGEDVASATARLRQLLTEIENGSFVRPSESRDRLLSRGKSYRLTLRQLGSEFLAEKRRTRGQQTASDYRSRLAPVLDFAETSAHLKRWPLAVDVDAEFVESLRSF